MGMGFGEWSLAVLGGGTLKIPSVGTGLGSAP
jgi:hypothetical protein